VKDLSGEYRSLVGAAEFDRATETLNKIIVHNDKNLITKK